jgi:hypothetical protein
MMALPRESLYLGNLFMFGELFCGFVRPLGTSASKLFGESPLTSSGKIHFSIRESFLDGFQIDL